MVLKVLPSEIDPAEIRFIRKAFIKERGAEFLEKFARPPSWRESPLNIPRHLIQLLEIRKRIANGAHGSVRGLLFTTYSCWQRHYEQI